MKQRGRKLLQILSGIVISVSMVLGLFSARSMKVYADTNTWRLGDYIQLEGKWFYPDDKKDVKYYGSSSGQYVPEPSQSQFDESQWCFNGAIWVDARIAGETRTDLHVDISLYLTPLSGKTLSDIPSGFKIKSGTGTEEDPYSFELIYDTFVENVTLNKEETTLTVSDTETLTATLTPADTTVPNVTWSSSDDSVATVDGGLVTAVAPGTAEITATATNGTRDKSDDKAAICKVTVNARTYSITVASITGGTVSTDPQGTATDGADVTITAAPESGYIVDSIQVKSGESFTDDVEVTKVSDTQYTFVMPKSNVQINAVFTKNFYTVVFNRNKTGSDQEIYSQIIKVGEETPLTPVQYELPGYTFEKWTWDPNGTGTSFADQQTVKDLTEAGKTYYLYAQWKEIVPPAKPNATWVGKTVTWEAVEGADCYEYKCSTQTSEKTDTITEPTVDLSEYIDEVMSENDGPTPFNFVVRAKKGTVYSEYCTIEKQFVKVIISPASKKINETYYHLDVEGGSVSGENFGDPDDYGTRVGIFGVGETVSISASSAQGYVFTKYEVHGDDAVIEDPTQEDQSFIINNLCIIYAYFDQIVLPVNVNLVIGKGHDEYAGVLLSEIKRRYPKFADDMSISADGTTLLLKIPAVNDYGNPITIGDLQYELDTAAGNMTMEVQDVDEYESYIAVTQTDSVENYSSDDDIYEERELVSEIPIQDGQLYYVLRGKPIDKVSINIEDPLCGTQVELSYSYPKDEDSQPKVNITEGKDKISFKKDFTYPDEKEINAVYWMTEVGTPRHLEKFSGMIVGGEKYYASLEMETAFGYYVKYNHTVVKINGKDPDREQFGQNLYLYAELTAVHDWGETIHVDPTLISEGSDKKVCSNVATCKAEEVNIIPKVTYYNSSGNGNVWTKGSTTTSDFTFKRTYEDSSFRFFTGIQVDGKEVAKTNYSASEGSTVIKLNAAYLETLSVGGHTITAMYTEPDVGSATASANFTVKDKATPSSGGSSKKPTTPADNVVTCQMAGYPANYNWNEAAKACQAGYIDAGGTFHPYRTAIRTVPNTSDRDIMIHAWIAMLSITIGLFCAVKLFHEDWEV